MMTPAQANARADLLAAAGVPSLCLDRLSRAIIYASAERRHIKSIEREIRKLDAWISRLKAAAKAWERA